MEVVAASTISVPTDDEREDGEIVDDFDEISDYSIPSSGKSDSSQNILRAISLSSISASEPDYNRKKSRRRNRHYLPPRKRRRDYEKTSYDYKRSKYYRKSLSLSSSDSDELDRSTLRRKLKEAVRINTSQEMHHNSLRSRLKAMIEPDSQEDDEINALTTFALMTSNGIEDSGNKAECPAVNVEEKEETFDDQELAELRLEALKSAMLKKHLERKRKKEGQGNNQNIIENNDINDKENAKSNILSNIDNKNTPMNETNNSKEPDNLTPEDDIDVMRAMLLASMSTKITSSKTSITKSIRTSTPAAPTRRIDQPKPEILKSKKALINQRVNIKNGHVMLPSVKPLIINLKSDSDSESEDKPAGSNTVNANTIDQTVSELLKKQREEFEAKIQNKSIPLKPKTNESLLDKSVLKLLPKSKQNEYHILKQKLLLASKKRKMRKLSMKSKSNEVKSKKENLEEKKNKLKWTLEQLQVEKNGRLQMKGKYKELGPLMQKVNLASEKRKQCSERVKLMINQLNEARTELDSSHKTYTELIRQLNQAMENIDKRDNKLTITSSKDCNVVETIEHQPVLMMEAEDNTQNIKVNDQPCEKESSESKEGSVEGKISANIANYVSPLDNRIETPSDPLQMLCPYELFGVCKDSECNFKHCP